MKVLKNIVDISRIFLSLVIAYLTIWTIATKWFDIYSMLRVLIVYLPALFFLVFKTKYLVRHPKLLLTYKIARAFFIIWLIVFIGATIWRMNYLNNTKAALDKINNARITMDDVMGTNLPPEPNKTLNDSTIAGFDVNNNGIRDDVELAIFAKYPDSAKIRAGMLQYAQEIQSNLTNVINSETWEAAFKDENNGMSCLMEVVFEKYPGEEIKKSDEFLEEAENLVLNTELRKNKINEIKKYEVSCAVGEGECDVSLGALDN